MNSIVFGRDKGERAEDYCLLGKCIIQKIRYSCYEMCIMQRMTRIDKNDVLRQYNDKCIMCSDKVGCIILSSVKLEKRFSIAKRVSSRLTRPLLILSSKTIEFIPFGAKTQEKRNHTISQMRLQSVIRMRMSILTTATTEQMGYDMISFFVCFSQ